MSHRGREATFARFVSRSLLALLLALFMGAAAAQDQDAGQAGEVDPEQPVIEIGQDETITQQQFEDEFNRATRALAAQQGVPYTAETREMFDRFRADFLDQLAIQRALLLEAEERGITVGEDEVEQQLDQARESFGGEEQFEQGIREFGYESTDAFREATREGLLAQRVTDEFRSEIELSDQDVETFFEENRAEFGDQPFEQVRPQVETQLMNERLNERFLDLRQRFGIETFPDRVSTSGADGLSRSDVPNGRDAADQDDGDDADGVDGADDSDGMDGAMDDADDADGMDGDAD